MGLKKNLKLVNKLNYMIKHFWLKHGIGKGVGKDQSGFTVRVNVCKTMF